MIRLAIVFAVLALIAGVLGFGNMAGDFSTIAKYLVLIFVILFVVAMIFGRKVLGGPTV